MSLTAFPEPKDLEVSFVQRIGDSRPLTFQTYTVENPHPGYGKDPNILNEYGHTKYPMWVGDQIANNAEEEAALKGEAIKPPAVDWSDAKPELKEDGPTVHEWVAAGYKAKNYPPNGYAAKSQQEEIDQAIKDELEAEAKSSGWGK